MSHHASVLISLFALCGCVDRPMTLDEAREAVSESVDSARVEVLVADSIEVSTDFTLGGAVEDAVEELRAFWASQVPCADVARDGDTVTVDYGDLSDDCEYNGHTYAGVHTITVVRTDSSDVEVGHAWVGFTNGELTVDGTADVTWSGTESSRRVVHTLEWDDGERTLTGSGDRTQARLDPVDGGIVVDGARAWKTSKGEWTLDIDGVEMRAMDPVPQAGSYTLTNPEGKDLVMDFERLDEDTIQVMLTGTRREVVFEVTSGTGEISDS